MTAADWREYFAEEIQAGHALCEMLNNFEALEAQVAAYKEDRQTLLDCVYQLSREIYESRE